MDLWRAWIADGRPDPDARLNAILRRYDDRIALVARQHAAKYPDRVTAEELVGSAWQGLRDAAQRYNPDQAKKGRGDPFWSFARPRVVGAILDEMRREDRLPRLTRARITMLARARVELMHELGRQPSREELADRLRWTEEQLHAIFLPSVSYLEHEPVSVPVKERCPAERAADYQRATAGLTFAQQVAIYAYYILGHTQVQIGDWFGVSNARVCQWIGEGVEWIRANKDRDTLVEILGGDS